MKKNVQKSYDVAFSLNLINPNMYKVIYFYTGNDDAIMSFLRNYDERYSL